MRLVGPAEGAYSAPPDSLAALKSKGGGEGGRRKRGGRKGEGPPGSEVR